MNTEIEISRLGLMGQGVGYDSSGNIYFVPGAIPGDRVRVEPEREDKRYRDARLIEIVKASPERITSPCEYSGSCGGCDYLHVDYPAQLKAKEGILTHVLDRSGWKIEATLPTRGAENLFGYRNRVQVRQRGAEIGFFKKGTRETVSIDHCLVARPEINEKIRELKLSPSKEPRKIEISVDEKGVVETVVNSPHGAAGFTQVNAFQNRVLREEVANRVVEMGAENVLELFCGDGNLTFSYLPKVKNVWAMDRSQAAIDRARKVAATGNATFLCAAVGNHALRKLPEPNWYDTLVLDPPRSGIPVPLEVFVQPNLKNIIYVSCSPTAFVHDVGVLKEAGFSFRSVQLVDMFPHTRHIEFISTFSRCL